MHINLTKELNNYLNWKSYKYNESISEIVRFLIKEDMNKNESKWMGDLTNDSDMQS